MRRLVRIASDISNHCNGAMLFGFLTVSYIHMNCRNKTYDSGKTTF